MPSFVAVFVAIRATSSQVHTAGLVLAGLWILMACTLWIRYRQARRAGDSFTSQAGVHQLDILSSTGRTTAWSAVIFLAAAQLTGWASLSVLGVLGLGLVCVAITWTALVAGGDLPWRRATIVRTISPDVGIEGEPLTEKLKLEGVKIPAAMRMFASGRPLRFGLTTRYAVGSEGSEAALELESDLGPAPRGEHTAPPIALWLGDVLGLTRTAPVHTGEATFAVMPRLAKVENVRELLGDGRDDMKSRDAVKMPTEGSFRIREYAPGDDTRRIHWVRSLQAGNLVVRLPDEIPPADPSVRIVLDNHFAGTDQLSCRAPAELLDVMIRVWLGIGKALADTGTRVTLVTGIEKGGSFTRCERPLHGRGSAEAAKFGARVAWQPTVRLDKLLDRTQTRQIVVSCRPRGDGAKTDNPNVQWVVVPHNDWTSREAWPERSFPILLPFAAGSAENRFGRRRAEQARLVATWQDRMLFSQLCAIDWKSFSGAYVARPSSHHPGAGNVMLQVIP
ncbi:MAG: DUF58 domain-containing protein [Deltaproteobacteria bacterium]|nr:DUF58 domain-containing protein [Deltaproteobacteria bacterium]